MTIHPQAFTDRHNRLWIRNDTMGGYRHDGTETLLADLETLQADAGPLTAPGIGSAPDDPNEIADRYLDLKAKTTPPRDVFEWCWEHSTDLPDVDRAALLHHAFRAVEFAGRAECDAYQFAATDPLVNGRLISAGYLALDGPAQAMWFPHYESWLTEHEVAW